MAHRAFGGYHAALKSLDYYGEYTKELVSRGFHVSYRSSTYRARGQGTWQDTKGNPVFNAGFYQKETALFEDSEVLFADETPAFFPIMFQAHGGIHGPKPWVTMMVDVWLN